jgi:predicted MPP superfamily phosphohydrolase
MVVANMLSIRPITRRKFLAGSSLAAAASVGLYTWQWEPHWIEVVDRTLAIDGLPDSLINATLVQLSDLHLGPRVDESYLRRVMARANEIAPDIVVYTGDFISYDDQFRDRVRRFFPQLTRGKLGTVGILGNHDYGPGWQDAAAADFIVSVATDSGIQILRNESAMLSGLAIVGFDELWADRFDPQPILRSWEPNTPSIALVHNPDAVDHSGWENYSGWILAGHTHGGQCKPPFLPPPLLPVQNRRYTCGEFELVGQRRLYINRGVGHLLRVRFNVRPEITRFTLKRLA